MLSGGKLLMALAWGTRDGIESAKHIQRIPQVLKIQV